MQTKIKCMAPLKCGIFKVIGQSRAALIVAFIIATGILGAEFVWQPTVSGQELFDIPKLEVVLPSVLNLPNEAADKKEHLDIGYLSAEKDSQLNDKFDNLIAKAAAEGNIPVIIGFRFDFKLDGDLRGSLITDQRAEIKLEQELVLQKIESFAPENVKQFSTIPYFAATVDAATLEYLKSLPEITSISEDELSAPTLAESVPLVGAPTAWANGYSGSGWTVAILDTGVNKAHTFLTNKVVSEACYSTTTINYSSVCPGGVAQSTANGSGYNCVDTISGCDHGTHVAGIAAGNGTSFSGVAKNSNLIPIQVFSKEISTNTVKSFTSDQVLGLERVMALRNIFNIAAVNMSLGAGAYSSTCDTSNAAETTAITNLRSVDIATVISSGNNGSGLGISSPACISTAVSVGSTGDGSSGATVDQVSSFSNSATILDLLAPGQFINSSVPGGTYENKSGTSMAAPHVAGAWAVLKQRVPNASVDTILNALRGTGLQIIDSRNNLIRPRIRIDAALRQLSGGTCGYSIPSGPGFVWARGGGGGTFAVNATESDCTWITSNIPSWITITSGVSGVGDGVVGYSVAANTTAFTRTGTISVGGHTFSISQLGDCVTALSPTSRSVGYGGDSGSYVGVSATSGCGWTATSNRSWISVTGNSSGSGNGGFTYSVVSNATGVDRTGAIIVLGKIFTITQSGNFTNCQTYTSMALNQTINGALTASDCIIGGSTSYVDQYSFNGTAGQKIAITMRSITLGGSRLYLTDPNGDFIGNGNNGRIPANNGFLTLPASGTYRIFATSFFNGFTGTYSLTLNDEATCGAVSISPINRHFPIGGGSDSINVAISSSCTWSGSFIYNGWLTITSGANGIGSGVINYTVAANSSQNPRNETININGLSFFVTQDGTAQTYEADVFNRPNGDGFVDSDDIQQVRRFSLGLDAASLGGEYQRADASPRTTLGDGYIDSDDVVQARRYALGLDTLQLAGGASAPSPSAPPVSTLENGALSTIIGKSIVRTLDGLLAAPAAFRVDNQNTSAGSTLVVPIRVDTVGNEAGYTFSIAFDSTKLINPQVMIGNSGGDVLFNSNNSGQIGFSVTTFSGGTIAAGNNKILVNVNFTVAAGAPAGTTAITFTDTPARRKASPVDPNFPITQPTYTGGTITIGGATAAGANVSGRAVTADGRGITNVQITMTGTNGETRTARTSAFGYFRFADVPARQSYVITAQAKRFTFGQNTQTRSISGDVSDVEFVADR